MFNRHVCLLVTGCTWAVMVFFLFEQEILPYFEYQNPPTYRTMLRDREVAVIRRYTISLGTRGIGKAETVIRPLPTGGHFMESRMEIRMGMIIGSPGRIVMKNEVRVDSDYRLSEFHLNSNTPAGRFKVTGSRQRDKLHVQYRFLNLKAVTDHCRMNWTDQLF